jgi:hypothetical protein
MSIQVEAETRKALADLVAALVPGFPVIELRESGVAKQDRFAAIETGLLKQEGPGIPMYQLPATIHIGTRFHGDGNDPLERDLDDAYSAVRAAFSAKRRFQISTGWYAVGMVPTEPEQRQDDTHNIRLLSYNIFIINKEV